ncbi:hypothetical protein D5R40_35210 [Okeania hirsuta]|uniref:Uncharacterized protein n=1 Tax=Okeania hirsuta TaxID=1458930 RepID=A0A3N6PQA5_9CYAN|nr:hypothetical protein D4Z78_31660 [Okeania hirsuta]RQH10591.1 hypothetical protein D5R40_35210 [Okeania hirsuta]RQH19868.1 hypothetical protein D4Z78_13100 [Okeania hirsuta]
MCIGELLPILLFYLIFCQSSTRFFTPPGFYWSAAQDEVCQGVNRSCAGVGGVFQSLGIWFGKEFRYRSPTQQWFQTPNIQAYFD